MLKKLRRRSRDAHQMNSSKPAFLPQPWPDLMPQAIHKPRRTWLVVGTLSTFVLAFFLILQIQQRRLPNPFTHWSGPAELTLGSSSRSFQLHPEDHAFRDATTHTFHWRVTADNRRPDGVLKRVYLINDEFPGPTIEVRSGDRLVIEVENALENGEGTSIHWHGLSMRQANDMDGAVGVTQSPILPGEVFTYNFTVDSAQHGTFWYHSHFAEQRADGLYGGLIVHEPGQSQDVDAEHLLLIGDWYHRTAEEALEYYMHPGAFGLETVPDSMVVNGEGSYHCANAVPARPVDCKHVEKMSMRTLKLETTERNMLRIINVGAYAGFEVSVPGSVLTADSLGGYSTTKGSAAKSVGYLHPGERMELLIEQDSELKDPDLRVAFDENPFKYDNMALTPTHAFPVQWQGAPTQRPQADRPVFERFDIQDATAAHDQSTILPATADHTIVLYTLTQKLAHINNEPHGFINNTMWNTEAPVLIDSPRDEWTKQLVPHIPYHPDSPVWVDIVLNNLDEDSHPFHMHGNDFWVLGKYSSTYNWGSYNPFKDATPPGGELDLVGAMKRDTFYVPKRGYAVLRMLADNPGLWAFHCHVLWHQASGMAMAFEVS